MRRLGTLVVLADQHPAVGEIHVGRHLEVVRRGLVLEDAAGHVEGRAVARAEEARPAQSSGSEGCGPGTNLSPGEQPRWVQMPTHDQVLGLDRAVLVARVGRRELVGLRSDFGIGDQRIVSLGSSAICSGVRRMIHTGLPRHSTVIFSPGLSPLMSTSTGAPAARARSEGWKLLTKGTARKPARRHPRNREAMIQVRLPPSICWSCHA